MKIDEYMKDRELTKAFLLLGFPDNLSGTALLKFAVTTWQPGMRTTKDIYPMMARWARSHGQPEATARSCERNCRHAIETAWMRGSPDDQMKIFGWTVDPQKGKPTISEFVCRLASYIYGDVEV